MMNLIAAMIIAYHTNTVANEYWFGFVLNHMVYVVTNLDFEDLRPFFKAESAAQSKGGHKKIRIKARVTECEKFLDRAICLGSEDILTDEKWNGGIMFEKIVTERIAGQTWVRDSVPFWVDSDITIGDRKIQVKMNGAELTNEKCIRKHFPEALT